MTEFISEIGANHNGDPHRLRRLIQVAKDCGCTGVKLQAWTPERLFAPGFLTHVDARGYTHPEWLPEAAAQAHDLGMRFGCSVYDQVTVGVVAPHVDFIKISSYSVLDSLLLNAVAATHKRTVLALGMATRDETAQAVKAITGGKGGVNIRDTTLLHCVSCYPTPAGSSNLGRLRILRHLYEGYKIGWSCHSVNPLLVLLAAIQFRADMIEVHLDLEDEQGYESEDGHCWRPTELAAAIREVHDAAMLSCGVDGYMPCEEAEREWRADPSDGLRPMRSKRA